MARFVLKKGVQHDSKYGLHKNGVEFVISDDNKKALRYFRTNGRYAQVGETNAPKTKKPIPPSARARKGAPAVTPERRLALARAPVDEGAQKKPLIALAKDLGVDLGANPEQLVKRQIISKIRAKQEELLREAGETEEEVEEEPEEEDEDSDSDEDEDGEDGEDEEEEEE
jgi:hypothetical protein